MRDSAISVSVKEGSILMNSFCLDGEKRNLKKLLLWEKRKKKGQRGGVDILF